jgi:hypothetical protein
MSAHADDDRDLAQLMVAAITMKRTIIAARRRASPRDAVPRFVLNQRSNADNNPVKIFTLRGEK